MFAAKVILLYCLHATWILRVLTYLIIENKQDTQKTVTKMIGTPKIWENSLHGVPFSIWRAFSIERKLHIKFWLVDQKGKRTMTSCKKCIHSYAIPVSVVDTNSCGIHYQVNLLVLSVIKMVSKLDVVSSKPLRGVLPPSACLLGSEFERLSVWGGMLI